MPHMYKELESKYCKDLRGEELIRKREEFNKLWNARATEG
jgi:hypothetical protein